MLLTWHLQAHKIMDRLDGVPARDLGAVSCGRGTDDLRVYKLLTGSIQQARHAARIKGVKWIDQYHNATSLAPEGLRR